MYELINAYLGKKEGGEGGREERGKDGERKEGKVGRKKSFPSILHVSIYSSSHHQYSGKSSHPTVKNLLN